MVEAHALNPSIKLFETLSNNTLTIFNYLQAAMALDGLRSLCTADGEVHLARS